MTRQLRDYQREADEAITSSGLVRPAIVLATGLGKTDVIAARATRAARAGRRVMVLAHRRELLDQIAERCRMHAPEIPVGIVQGATRQVRRPIIVAMQQTMAGESAQLRTPVPDEVIVDECHHAASPSYLAILRWAGCFGGRVDPETGEVLPPTPALGVTATMSRGDKRGLGDVWQGTTGEDGQQHAVYERGIGWAIEHGPSHADPLVTAPVGDGASRGWLVRPHGRVVVASHMDLGKAKTRGGDYVDAELGEMVAQDVDQIVKAWQEHAADRLTVAFTPSRESARMLADEFRCAGVPVGEVYGNTKPGERERVYRALRTGAIRVLVSVMVTTEGWDCPPVSCVLQARPTKLPGLYVQMVGRGLRPSPETGKTDCLVLDVVGASRALRLQTVMDLHESATQDRSELDALPCEVCGGFLPGRAASDEAPDPCSCAVEPKAPGPGRKRLQGPARYDDVDLLGSPDAGLNWLETEAGVPFVCVTTRELDAQDKPVRRYGVIWPEGSDLWSAGHCAAKTADGQWLTHAERTSRAAAVEAVEAWALEAGSPDRRSDPWRVARSKASEAQQRRATRMGIAAPETYTRGGLSNAMDVAEASWRLDRT